MQRGNNNNRGGGRGARGQRGGGGRGGPYGNRGASRGGGTGARPGPRESIIDLKQYLNTRVRIYFSGNRQGLFLASLTQSLTYH